MYLLQLQRSPDNEEAQDQLMKANELEELQEEAHAAYHQGDYSGTINVLERAIEVCVSSAMQLWAVLVAKISISSPPVIFHFFSRSHPGILSRGSFVPNVTSEWGILKRPSRI